MESSSNVIEVYPLNRHYFASKEAYIPRDVSPHDRVLRLGRNYVAHGMRTRVEGVLLVELFGQPHVLLLQMRNSQFILPGGRLRQQESEIEGLKRKLLRRLSGDGYQDDWEIGECIGKWWRSNFETLPYPYMHRKAKECIKVYLVKSPMTMHFVVPGNMKILAVPLCQLHDNVETYGEIIAGLPQLLSKYSFNFVED